MENELDHPTVMCALTAWDIEQIRKALPMIVAAGPTEKYEIECLSNYLNDRLLVGRFEYR